MHSSSLGSSSKPMLTQNHLSEAILTLLQQAHRCFTAAGDEWGGWGLASCSVASSEVTFQYAQAEHL